MTSPDEANKPTLEGLRRCAVFLSFCLEVGWEKVDLDWLEDLWWRHHDHTGALKDPYGS